MGELDAEENGPQWADTSTHAPVLGRTFQTLHAGSCQTASTHAPRGWANHPDKALWTYPFLLQLTPREGERPWLYVGGAVADTLTHAPRMGGERAPVVAISSAMQLQLTPP